MSTPDQPRHDEHGRSGGGVRGAINDLLGRGDRTDDDRRVEDQRFADGPSDARHDVGTADPRRADDGFGTPAGTVGADPRHDGDVFDDRGGEARHRDATMDGPGHDPHAPGTPQAGGPVQAQRQDLGDQDLGRQHLGHQSTGYDGQQAAGYEGQQSTGYEGRQTMGAQDMGHQDTRHDVRHDTDVQPGVGHRDDTGPAGARTVDVGGPEATTAPVAPTHDRTAPAAMDTNGSTARSGATVPSQGEDEEGRERLVSADRAESYGSRWDAVKGEFVDEPRKAVADADALVGELLDELQTLFTEQRQGIERNLDADETSTEDMRLALRRYRSFFDRLLSI
jgi:hypothetical protein